MHRLPEYRLRLFLSVDLVGSTAFKAEKATQQYDGSKVKPKWVSVFTEFYEEFPILVHDEFEAGKKTLEQPEFNHFPRRWKTIGDELILCCRVLNIEHLSYTVDAFVVALKKYVARIKQKHGKLSVKGNAWVAACPAPNIGFALDPTTSKSAYDLDTTEEIEREIDIAPHKFDFLGKAIDTGFRISRNSRADRCTLSVQLAYLLATAKGEQKIKFDLGFDGRMELKGVNDGIPYPVIYIETETDSARKKLSDLEGALNGKKVFSSGELIGFLEAFMKVAAIEKPYVFFRDQDLSSEPKPKTYVDFETAFRSAIEELKQRDQTLKQGEAPDAEVSEPVDLDTSFLRDLILEAKP